MAHPRFEPSSPSLHPPVLLVTNSHHAYLGSMVLHQPTRTSMHSDLRLALASPFMRMRVPHSCVIYPSMGKEGTHFELPPRVEQAETDSPSGCKKFCTNSPGHCTTIRPSSGGRHILGDVPWSHSWRTLPLQRNGIKGQMLWMDASVSLISVSFSP